MGTFAASTAQSSRAGPYSPGPSDSDDITMGTRRHRPRSDAQRWVKLAALLLASLVAILQALDGSADREPLPQPAPAADALPTQQVLKAPAIMLFGDAEPR